MGRRAASVRTRVHPAFGPTLPALLHDRFGVPPRATLLAIVAVPIGVAGAAIAARPAADGVVVVHRDDPRFALRHSGEALSRVPPRRDELVRLEGRRGRMTVSLTVSPLHGPAAAASELPLVAERRIAKHRRRLPGFHVREEGTTAVTGTPGYVVGYRARGLSGRDVLVVPGGRRAGAGVVVTLRRSRAGARVVEGERLFEAVLRTLASFRFGTNPA